jgi:alpha-beta hydrolase superfamily lysophospholipase
VAVEHRRRIYGLAAALGGLLILGIAACAPTHMPSGPGATTPHLTDASFVAGDGLALPLRHWLPDGKPEAVVLALHGFNDYSKAFEEPGSWLAEHGIAVYAYDQRGFGAGPHSGLWAGSDRLVADAKAASELLHAKYPGVPLYLLGESMGGAVVIAAETRPDPPQVAGVILSAPAVWSRDSMPFYQRAALWFAAHVMPWAKFSGSGLHIQASDNIEMLRGLGRDPLFIKETRVDAMDGLTDLMSEALEAAPRFKVQALLLYGDRDEVVPRAPSLRFWRDLPATANGRQQRALYENGWHLLLRDLQAKIVLADIAQWIEKSDRPLPSGADLHAETALHAEDGTEVVDGAPAPAAAGGAPLSGEARTGS